MKQGLNPTGTIIRRESNGIMGNITIIGYEVKFHDKMITALYEVSKLEYMYT